MTTSKLDACLAAQIWNQTTRVVGVCKKLSLAGKCHLWRAQLSQTQRRRDQPLYATDKRSPFCPPIILIKARGYFRQLDGVPRCVTTAFFSSRPDLQRWATSWYRRGSPRHLREVLLRSTTIMWRYVCFPAQSLPLKKKCNGILAWPSAGSSDTASLSFNMSTRTSPTFTMTPLSFPTAGPSCSHNCARVNAQLCCNYQRARLSQWTTHKRSIRLSNRTLLWSS
jgi:hypothetical protein